LLLSPARFMSYRSLKACDSIESREYWPFRDARGLLNSMKPFSEKSSPGHLQYLRSLMSLRPGRKRPSASSWTMHDSAPSGSAGIVELWKAAELRPAFQKLSRLGPSQSDAFFISNSPPSWGSKSGFGALPSPSINCYPCFV
jgi:hypothetical protein